MKRFEESLKEITPLNKNSIDLCEKVLNSKMKPIGSLGKLEDILKQLSGIFENRLEKLHLRPCHIVASADNGIVEEGVSSCPKEYTSLVSKAMLSDLAAISIMCKNLDIDFKLADVGICEDLNIHSKNLYDFKTIKGTHNFHKKEAMTKEQVIETIENGIIMMEGLENKYDIFSNGEMGIGNTTTSSAILYSLTKCSIETAVGRGGGLSDEKLCRKKKIIFESCIKYNTFQLNPLEILACVGGLDIAFLVGLYIGAAKCKKIMLVDGFISAIAALVACKLNPLIKNYILITHLSEEPGMQLVIDELGLKPFLFMNMRLGEGTGAVLAHPMIKSAIDIYKTMKTPNEIYELFSK
ncbi:MAG: nicotinate-nucleotide--dimethylbenzimidazole phosphoribosyltransferase [Fusobacterium sp. JB021]|nr:nicotinate-nucleotide--dimethylbenzimidazole phosphoribosyltransferase [Fusobacterium sp. JB021]MDP0507356.1 nicotinate-nucleotide--dimethylbenzimidazole phosphoribosyltransferase [Fusobacterium sp. JB019]